MLRLQVHNRVQSVLPMLAAAGARVEGVAHIGEHGLHERMFVAFGLSKALAEHGLLVSPGRAPLKYLKIGASEKAIAVCRRVFDDGFFTNIAVYPAVPRDGSGIRLLFNVQQTIDDVKDVVKSLAAALGR